LHSATCECSNTDCVERIDITPSEHRMARTRDDRFLIAPRHDNPEIERVVYRHDRYWIVQKHPDPSSSQRREHRPVAKLRDGVREVRRSGAISKPRICLSEVRSSPAVAWVSQTCEPSRVGQNDRDKGPPNGDALDVVTLAVAIDESRPGSVV
jgi:hypothetical protein